MNPALEEPKLPKNVNFEDLDLAFAEAAQARDTPGIEQVVEALVRQDMLPAIYFIFRRKGCDQAAKRAAQKFEHRPVVGAEEKRRLHAALEQLREDQPDAVREDMVWPFLHGFASHHAGSLPGWKALVEKCFQQGLIKVVFATDTLAAGINMPARTTVISELQRMRDARKRSMVTHNELLQMAGRAGRRGFDDVGFCVLLDTPRAKPEQVCEVIRKGPEPVDSQFAVDYSMALNLMDGRSLPEAQALIRRSFLNYQSSSEEEAGALDPGTDDEPAVDPVVAKRLEAARTTLNLEQQTLELLLEQAVEARTEAVWGTMASQLTLPCSVGLDFGRDAFGRGLAALMPGAVLARLPAGEQGREEDAFLALGADNCFYQVAAGHIAALGPDVDEAALPAPLDSVTEMGLAAAADLLWTQVAGGTKAVAAPASTAGVAACLPAQSELAAVGMDAETEREIADARARVSRAKAEERRALRDYVVQQRSQQPQARNYVSSVSRWLRGRQQTVEGRLAVEEREVRGAAAAEAGAEAAWVCTVTDRLTREALAGAPQPRKALAKQDAFRLTLQHLRRTESFVRSLQQLNAHLMCLIDAGCLLPDSFELTVLGRIAAALKGENELWLASALTADVMYTLSPSELAGAVCALVTSDSVRVKDAAASSAGSENVVQAVTALEPAWHQVVSLQQTYRVGRDPVIDVRLAGLAEQWAEGCSWAELMDHCSLDEGDLARLLHRTMDVLNQARGVEELPEEIRRAARAALKSFDRQPISHL
mmetsp:Transcript_34873/g.98392  ORF Transcript_34873/g.98392 Transcript_34873/m.98392 type:complete len:765 (+) Transcript_34873:207-2501(+)